jgi:dipeptidyl aminopeptidase/acylaminoacyl peptidase
LWERSTGRLRQLHDRAVDIQFGENPFVWLDHRRLVFAVLPPGERPIQMDLDFRAARKASAFWDRYLSGSEATASALESGVPSPPDRRPDGSLLVVDVTRGSQAIAQGEGFRSLTLSPDRRSLAFLKQVGTLQPEPDRPLPHGRPQLYSIYQAMVKQVDAESPPLPLPPDDVMPGTLRWSPDSTGLALIGGAADAGTSTPEFHRCRLGQATCSVAAGNLEAVLPSGQAAPSVWSSGNELVVFARQRSRAARTAGRMPRRDWWALSPAGSAPRNLTAGMSAPPGRLLPDSRKGLVGLAEGQLWRVSLNATPPGRLSVSIPGRIEAIAWPTSTSKHSLVFDELIVRIDRKNGTGLYRLEVASGRMTAIQPPAARPVVADYHPAHRVAALTAKDDSGTYLWLSPPGLNGFTTVVETNVFLREVAEASTRRVQYRGLDGGELTAWLLLPFGYHDGTRYPMITSVYAGSMAGGQPPAQTNSTGPLNLQLLAAHGYAVLIPSMPLEPVGEASDPYLDLTKGVLPAVDKAIDLGIADPKRLGIIGHSYGGYSTYGLITQTSRFQAAVSLAGLSDLVSFYGQFDPRFRYEAAPHHVPFQMSQAESGQLRMGGPPWEDAGRFVRNSPLTYVDRVTTPLMIIQGDQDFVPMAQGEMFFSALNRQQKRATMVRYWGEGHLVESPANILDMWTRIFDWFDEFLQPEAAR